MADAPAGGGMRGTLQKKWGPLPVWAYGVGGAVVLFLLMRGRGGGAGSGSFAVGSPATAMRESPGSFGVSGGPADNGSAIASLVEAIRGMAPPVINVFGTPGAVSSPQGSATAGHGAAPPVERTYTYPSPGPTEGYAIPKGAPLQNVVDGTTVTPISLSDYAVKNRLRLPGAVPLN